MDLNVKVRVINILEDYAKNFHDLRLGRDFFLKKKFFF